ncbi:MAG TPA: sigma-54 dependent transcriptional regulator, partial [Candidatus Binataceae bacterium]|nr:sigma-54 dependent transcriptional regulator [Candidatus Binataceae bacterium]
MIWPRLASEPKGNTDFAYNLEAALIGQHPTIVKLRQLIERVARTEATVLISGESGTGKEVVARGIHMLSARRDHNFVPVNCAAIPHDLLESEMFGHERGAFTGASGHRQGLFAMANGGTLFLDEIGEMPPVLQAKLLRVLEDGVVRPVGSDRGSQVNARVIAASNSDLAIAVKRGAFREDLYYRIQVIPMILTPLRERRSDIGVLIEHFMQKAHERMPGHNIDISREAMVHLWSYDWPGNVRELENMIERLLIICTDDVIDTPILPPNLVATKSAAEAQIPDKLTDAGLDLNNLVRELEGKLINEALKQTGGNKQAAAKLLGLKRTTFAAKLRRCGVITPSTNGN